MKNLFLPFVVLALFAVGSCGDEASINPPVDGKDTTDVKDSISPVFLKGEITITDLPMTFEQFARFGSASMGYHTFIELSDSNIQYRSTVTHTDNSLYDSLMLSTGRDTLQVIERYLGPSLYDNRLRFALVMDSVQSMLPYLKYEYTNVTSNSNGTTRITREVILKDVPYRRTLDSVIVEVGGNTLQNSISRFKWVIYKGSVSEGGSNGSIYSSSDSTYIKEFKPFTDNSKIRIVLLKK